MNLATASQAAAYIPFLNLQYIYCWIVTLFGKACAVDSFGAIHIVTPDVTGALNAATSTVGNAVTTAGNTGGGFWSWLWPFGSSASSATNAGSAAGTAADVGFWASLGALVPGPVKAVFVFFGTVLGFLWTVFSWLSFTFSGLLFLAILAALGGLILIRIKEWTDFGTLPPRSAAKSYGWSRWQDQLNEAMSSEPKRWRTAIVTADEMLGELLERLGYHGEATAEQLRSVPEGAFVTLPQAWEAHRIRNFVTARKSNFILTQREAFRVMKLYEQVFEEFDFI